MNTFINQRVMPIGSVEAILNIEVCEYEEPGEAWGQTFYQTCIDVDLLSVEVEGKDILDRLNNEWREKANEIMCEA